MKIEVSNPKEDSFKQKSLTLTFESEYEVHCFIDRFNPGPNDDGSHESFVALTEMYPEAYNNWRGRKYGA
jgi:hypothetical protein